MKIEPYLGDDPESREKYKNDGYDEGVIRYWEDLDAEGYFYEVYVLLDGAPAQVVITESGVSIYYKYGETIFTDIKPNEVFGELESLEWDNIEFILSVIKRTNAAGTIVSATKMDAMFQEWKDLGEP